MRKPSQQAYEVHPAAELFPMMGDREFSEFKADIETHGIKEWGTLYRGQVLDGRNRYKACQELGIEMDFCEIEDKEDFDPIAYVLSHNLHRRHLTTSQRSDVAGKVATMRHGGDRKSEDIKGSKDTLIDDTKSIADAAAQMKVSPASVKRAKKVHAKGSESTKKALADGSLPVTTAAAFVDAVPDKKEQEAIVAQGPSAVKEAVKTVPKKVPKGSAVVPNVKSYLTDFKAFWNKCDEIGKKAIYVWLQDNYTG
jgi:ParB-like chromosome segregation protein Spo0J